MSRLDDELRAAFRRVEPSSDFAERVIGRINNRPSATKPSLWQRLKSFLEPPVARWVAVGVATSLLVAIFAAQYTQLQEATPEHQAAPGIAERQSPEIRTDKIAPLPEKQPPPTIKHKPVKHRVASNRNLLAQQRKERRHKIEAEQAKEQVMLALQIASTTLNEANKMVRGDD
ncbi:MAG TPA: hypothetical protein VF131_12460 [Blastocatellia bacterium]|nr:hypothetical protein [Blastocatellia bacterium]